MSQPRAPRADSVRNRENILAAARQQIALHGPDAAMDEIAAAAGVAVGTLYRHFATKADLVAAIIDEPADRLVADADAARKRARSGASALDELTAYLEWIVEASAADRAVKSAAERLAATRNRRARAALAELIRIGQADGEIHPDLTAGDLYLLLSTAPTDRRASDRARWLELVYRAITA